VRQPQHLSPTSLGLFYENPTEYYLMYLADNRPPKAPQTQPMSIGSSFDAYVKSYLHGRLFGEKNDPRFEFKSLFEAQVEPHNRDWALTNGEYVFQRYKESGALADLMLELGKAVGPPRFELEVKGVVNGTKDGMSANVLDVPLLGKPDLFFINSFGAHVILDWKVNGYCSNYPPSPMKGFIKLREKGVSKGQHKEAQVMSYKGMMINVATFLEHCNEQWAAQLAIYSWLCGVDIGSDFITAIDQVVCKKADPMPILRFADHRCRISPTFQWSVFQKAQAAWEIINSGHFFRDLSLEDSIAKSKMLDGVADALKGDGSEEDKFFSEMTRQ
jgi:PD-(D/E)XK nuclease superfamily